MSVASKNGEWEPVIGLEMHARLLTRSKIFSGAASGFCETPNAQICEIDLGMPGVLPTLNRAVVDSAIVFGLAVGGKIAPLCEFARKNYFYPDLSKGYQISQYEHPIVSGGRIEFAAVDGANGVDLTRAHLEEDAGKLTHEIGGGLSGVDYNRAGCPLLEIVTEPQIKSSTQASMVARATWGLVRWLGICDGNMQEGSFRIDANVSLRRVGSQTLGTRCEIKNLNSFRFLIRALEFEIERQRATLAGGGVITQQTRLFDAESGETRAMRDKEDADDYRYFPDPDLPPLQIDDDHIEQLRARCLPETSPPSPSAARARLEKEYGLSPQAADLLIERRESFRLFHARGGRRQPETMRELDLRRFDDAGEARRNRHRRIAREARKSGGINRARGRGRDFGSGGERNARQNVEKRREREANRRPRRLAANRRRRRRMGIAGGANRGRESQAGGAIRGRQTKGDGLVCRPSDEANRRQSRPETAESNFRAPARARRRRLKLRSPPP